MVLGALSHGQKVVLAVVPGNQESTSSWSVVLRDLKTRGLRAPWLVIGDGHLGLWAGLRNDYPEVEEQRCWNHKIFNVVDKFCQSANRPRPTLSCVRFPLLRLTGRPKGGRRNFYAGVTRAGIWPPPSVSSGTGNAC